jgi:ribosomal protein RSM22 (predicted rRNA methylase)
MRLPAELLEAIQQETEKIDRRKLALAAAQLTEHYQSADFSSPAITSDAHRAAYLAVRFPATYAAVRRVLSEIRRRVPQAEINSLLDLGAGPGTVLFAASEEFALQQATLIEVDTAWLALAKRLAAQTSLPIAQTGKAAKDAQWLKQDLRSSLFSAAHDLVVISYTLGELPQAAADSVLRKAWSYAGKFLVIIEPGTMRGFAAVNTARSILIASAGIASAADNAAKIIAPCPHHVACPMAAANDWCHFAQRVERTSQHRQLKGGTLGYEDEKFSYLIAAKPAALPILAAESHASPSFSRIVRHPLKRSGYVQLSLCTPPGQIKNQTVTRSSKATYKSARQSEWGDTWAE